MVATKRFHSDQQAVTEHLRCVCPAEWGGGKLGLVFTCLSIVVTPSAEQTANVWGKKKQGEKEINVVEEDRY